MKSFFQPVVQCLLLLFITSPLYAEIYHYVDDNGRKIYVDRLSKIPSKYRNQLKTYQEEKDRLSQEEFLQLNQFRDLDQNRNKLRIERQKLEKALAQWATPYSEEAGRLVVPVKAYYGSRSQTLNLVVDTGASYTVLHKASLSNLQPLFKPGAPAQVADGSIVQTEKIHLDRFSFGPFNAKSVSVAVIDYKGGSVSQGLLGMDFLSKAQYQIDRENKLLLWNPDRYKQLQEKLLELEKIEQQLDQHLKQK